MNGISGVSFYGHETAGTAAHHIVQPKPCGSVPGAVYFKGNDYPYYNPEPKSNHSGLKAVFWTTVAAATVIGDSKLLSIGVFAAGVRLTR